LLALGFAAFTLLGVALVLVGASQAELARALGLDLARSGLLGAALPLGAGVGVTLAGPVVDRLPRRPVFLAAVLLAALAGLGVEPTIGYARALAHVFALGVGIGVYDTLMNALVIERYGAASGRPLALLHAGATLGAVVGPPLVGWLASHGDWSTSFRVTGGALLALCPWVAALPLPAPLRLDGRHARGSHAPLASRALLALAGVGFSYVGVETGVTLFCVAWSHQGLGLGEARGRAAISSFWLGLLLGRLALLGLRRPPGVRLLAASGLGGALFIAAAVVLRAFPLEAATGLAGLCLGAVYPVMMALTGRHFPAATGTATGLVAGAAALGGFCVPWLAGALGDATGIAAALASLAAVSLGISAAALAIGAPRSGGAGAAT
jgi:fucose permease